MSGELVVKWWVQQDVVHVVVQSLGLHVQGFWCVVHDEDTGA